MLTPCCRHRFTKVHDAQQVIVVLLSAVSSKLSKERFDGRNIIYWKYGTGVKA